MAISLSGTNFCVRPIRRSDVPAILLLASDPLVAETCGMRRPVTALESSRFVHRALHGWRTGAWLTFVVAYDERVLGVVMLEVEAAIVYLSYCTGAPYSKRGVATRATRAAIRFAFEKLYAREIRARVLRRNSASRRVLRANGFFLSLAATREEPSRDESKFPAVVVYHLVRTDIARRDTSMTLQRLLDDYAEIYQLPAIALDANDMCRLCFRGKISVDIEPSRRPGCFHLYTALGRIPDNADAHWFRSLLEGNLFGRDSGFASVACDSDTSEVLLCQLLDAETLTAERFDLLLQDFVQSADTLRDRLVEREPAAVADGADVDFFVHLQNRA